MFISGVVNCPNCPVLEMEFSCQKKHFLSVFKRSYRLAANAFWCKCDNELWTCWKGQEMKREKRERKGRERGSAIWRIKVVQLAKENMKAVIHDPHSDPSELWKYLLFGSKYLLEEVAVVIWWTSANAEFKQCETPLLHLTLDSILTIKD